jgi:hypothetical protein
MSAGLDSLGIDRCLVLRQSSIGGTAAWRPTVGEEGGVRRPAPNTVGEEGGVRRPAPNTVGEEGGVRRPAPNNPSIENCRVISSLPSVGWGRPRSTGTAGILSKSGLCICTA